MRINPNSLYQASSHEISSHQIKLRPPLGQPDIQGRLTRDHFQESSCSSVKRLVSAVVLIAFPCLKLNSSLKSIQHKVKPMHRQSRPSVFIRAVVIDMIWCTYYILKDLFNQSSEQFELEKHEYSVTVIEEINLILFTLLRKTSCFFCQLEHVQCQIIIYNMLHIHLYPWTCFLSLRNVYVIYLDFMWQTNYGITVK